MISYTLNRFEENNSRKRDGSEARALWGGGGRLKHFIRISSTGFPL